MLPCATVTAGQHTVAPSRRGLTRQGHRRQAQGPLALGALAAGVAVRGHRRAVATASEVAPAEATATGKAFSWERQWYPVLPLAMLSGQGPEPVRLLGKDLVLWKDADDHWVCTGGICPHRLAPLAHGRVNEKGELMCRFHGWCFKGDGHCAKVPMAVGDHEAESRLLGQPRSRLATYPTRVKKGLLFVWPHASSPQEAESSEPFVPEELGDEPNWSCFDVPAGWRVWLEQSWDPSHAPFLHQYALPNFAPEQAVAMEPFEIEDLGDEGLKVKHGGYMKTNMGMKADRRFVPPCANSTTYLYPDGRVIGFNFYFVPTEPGKVRQITTSYFVPSAGGESSGNLKGNMMQMSKVVLKGRSLEEAKTEKAPVERWPRLAAIRRGLESWKLLQGLLGDQDNTVLSFQDSVGLPAVQQGQMRHPAVSERYGGPPSEYLLETHADALVARFGAWVAARGGGPLGAQHVTHPEEAVFDRWSAHTSFSKDAQAALHFLSTSADLGDRVALIAGGAAAALLGFGSRWAAVPLLAAVGALAAARKARSKAQGFLSGLPAAPAVPKRKLWE